MKKEFKKGFIGFYFTIGYIYGYIKNGVDMKVGIKNMVKFRSIKTAHKTLRNSRKDFLESI